MLKVAASCNEEDILNDHLVWGVQDLTTLTLATLLGNLHQANTS